MVERGDFAKKPRVSSMIRKEKRRGELMMLVEAKNEDEEDRWEKLYFILKQNNFLCCYTNKDESTMAGPPIDLLIWCASPVVCGVCGSVWQCVACGFYLLVRTR
jgi:hypothetical protein